MLFYLNKFHSKEVKWKLTFTLVLVSTITLSLCLLQYGRDYEFEAPVKLLDKHFHAMAQSADEQLVVVSQVSSFSENFFPGSWACFVFN